MNEIKVEEKIKSYAKIREIVEQSQAQLNEMIDNFKQSDEYQAVENWLMINKQSLQELDNEIESAAVLEWNKTGNKKPFPGIGIREMTKYDYDFDEALAWAKDNMPAILTLDRKKFEKILSVSGQDGLSVNAIVRQEPIATIAKDLSMYLEDEQAGE